MSTIKKFGAFCEKHPVLKFIFLTIAENLIWLLVVALFKFLKQKYHLYLFLSKTPIDNFDDYIISTPKMFTAATINIWLIGSVLLLLITLLVMWICHMKTRRKKAEADFKVLQAQNQTLSNTISEQSKQINNWLPMIKEYKEDKELKEIVGCLSDYTQKSDIVDSIQLYTYPQLSAPKNVSSTVNIPFQFITGTASSESNVNALYHINYQLDYNIYRDLYNLFDERNAYYSEHKQSRDVTIERSIQEQALKVFKNISTILNNIPDASCISDEHYAYYRMLEILTTLVIAKEELVECKKLLEYSEVIETQLKQGQRTGLLGAIFVASMYYFGNENSVVKKNRGYFATPFTFKGHKMMMLVVLQRNKLRLAPKHQEIECCTEIYDEIASLLAERFSERSPVCQ